MSSESTTGGQNTGASYFSRPDECRQLGLEVENQIFWVSKEYLSSYSPVFKAMLYGKFNETGENVIPLPEKKAEDVLQLLLCLFPTPLFRKIDYTNVRMLLAFANEYQMVAITFQCCDFFDMELSKLPDGDPKLLEILTLASKYRLHRVLFSVVERCAKCFTMGQFQEIFDQLSTGVIGAIIWTKFVLTQDTLIQSFECTHCHNMKPPIIAPLQCDWCGARSQRRNVHVEPDLWRCGIEDLLKRM